jgi:LuxR family maltose regulon positive regulatory protein
VFLLRMHGAPLYRYHSLFAALLRAVLRQEDPELHRALHGRAAHWYASHDMAPDAEEHARAAGDWDLVGDLVAARWLDQLVSGDENGAGMGDGLPAAAITGTPSLGMVAAGLACARNDRDSYRQAAGGIGSRTPDAEAPASDTADDLTTIQLAVDVLRGRAFGADAAAKRAANRLQAGPPGCDPRLRAFGGLRGAELALDRGDTVGVRRRLASLDPALTEGWAARMASSLVALSYALEGRLEKALAALDDAERSRRQVGGCSAHVAALAAALIYAQRGQRAAAVAAAATAEPIISSRPLRAIHRAVHAALAPGRSVGLDAATAPHPAASLALIAMGAVEVLDTTGTPVPVGGASEAALRRARHRLETRSYGGVLDALEPWVSGVPTTPRHVRSRIEALVLSAIAASEQGDQTAALSYLGRALDVAGPDRLWAPFFAYGQRVVVLLELLVSLNEEHLDQALPLLDASSGQQPAFVHALTEQEDTVLRFLPTLMSNAEIAETMHLSVNTVKTHLKSVYRKLGVERRRDAVVRARQLELLA